MKEGEGGSHDWRSGSSCPPRLACPGEWWHACPTQHQESQPELSSVRKGKFEVAPEPPAASVLEPQTTRLEEVQVLMRLKRFVGDMVV